MKWRTDFSEQIESLKGYIREETIFWPLWSKSGPKVVQKWSKSGPKVVRKWSESGPKVVRKLSESGPKVVQKWFSQKNSNSTCI